MTHVKSLVAMSIEKMLLKTSGPTFLKGIAFMFSAGLSPDRITVMQTKANKYILQFHSRCDVRPFAANYPEFKRLLRGIVHIRAWRLKSIEFLNVSFQNDYVPLIEKAVEMLGVELVLLNNCSYPGIEKGDQALRLFSAFNRKKSTIVCEYGEERLKTLINGYRTRPLTAPNPAAPVPPMGRLVPVGGAPVAEEEPQSREERRVLRRRESRPALPPSH
ncbi:hypothetical protein PMAYCL1PPCAC_02962 [Pristionchus mayeri]|uniref:Uncharacterized protein n=1 Tax=Pristionchus mayeri TaxID=1317129 RepID=A0AAN4Z1F0_9BILA|nr:hypothetical protein PMAYCL1PPCAC_02962 [Pristionchus mayeri]